MTKIACQEVATSSFSLRHNLVHTHLLLTVKEVLKVEVEEAGVEEAEEVKAEARENEVDRKAIALPAKLQERTVSTTATMKTSLIPTFVSWLI